MKRLKFGLIRIVIIGLLFLANSNFANAQQPPNATIIANDDNVSMSGGVININHLGNDTYPTSGYTVNIVKPPIFGNIDPTQSSIYYGANDFVYKEKNFQGKDTIGYRLCDAQGICDTAFISIDYERPTDSLGGQINPGQIIFDPTGMTAAEIQEVRGKIKEYDGVRTKSCPCGDLELWEFPDWDIETTSKGVTEETELDNDRIAYNYEMEIFDLSTTGLSNIGLSSAPAVVTDFTPIVAVVDSGVEPNLEDFNNNLWSIPAGDCGFMNNNMGYNLLDTLHPMQDEDGHGTHISGIVLKDNPYTKVMPLRVVNQETGSLFDAICGIRFAIDNGATLVNLSMTQKGARNGVFATTMEMAKNSGMIVVCSAGNDSINLDVDTMPYWPGAFDYDNIVNVTAIDADDELCDFANFGATDVDVAAPGLNIQSLSHDNVSDGVKSGTSMATAFATRELALIKYENPTWNYLQVINRLYDESVGVPSLAGKTSQGKRLGSVTYEDAETSFMSCNMLILMIGLILLLIILFLLIKWWKKRNSTNS